MAKRNNRLLLYGGVAALGVAGFLLTEPPPEEPADPADRPTARRAAARERVEVFTKEDELARFARLDETTSNAFRPGVVDGKAGSNIATQVNQVPPSFADGEATWFYTGTAYIDSVPMVLFENTANGSGEYLKLGQNFRKFTVSAITPSSVTITGPDGSQRTLLLIENRPIVDDPRQTSASIAPNAPFNPMSGPIGLNPSGTPNRIGGSPRASADGQNLPPDLAARVRPNQTEANVIQQDGQAPDRPATRIENQKVALADDNQSSEPLTGQAAQNKPLPDTNTRPKGQAKNNISTNP